MDLDNRVGMLEGRSSSDDGRSDEDEVVDKSTGEEALHVDVGGSSANVECAATVETTPAPVESPAIVETTTDPSQAPSQAEAGVAKSPTDAPQPRVKSHAAKTNKKKTLAHTSTKPVCISSNIIYHL